MSISVNASGSDEGSGIISYSFQISSTQNDEDFTTVRTEASTEGTCSYKYSNLEVGKNYYLRVIVADRAGYQTTSEITKQGTQDNGVPDETLSSSIGRYVAYTPVSGSFSSNVTYNGYTTQNFSTDTAVKWRIMFVEDNKISLISEEPVNNGFRLQGANGYNNGVLLLNDACKTMYSNSSLGAIGRSIDIDDLEEVSNYNKNNYSGYGGTETPDSWNNYYPNIYEDERTGSVAGIGQSEQEEYITGYSQASALSIKQTYYSYIISTTYMSSSYMELFYYEPSSINTYWFASRVIDTGYEQNGDDRCVYYGLFFGGYEYMMGGWSLQGRMGILF